MNDLISRQAAIDALDKLHYNDREDWCFVLDTVEYLPSAQPNIRCKNCQYYDPAERPEESDWCHAWAEVTTEDGFCHNAKERRCD